MAQTAFAPPPVFVGAVLDHDMPWTDWLEPGETITAFTVTSNSPDLVISNAAEADGVVSWRITVAAARKVYLVTVAIESSDGSKDKCVLTYRLRTQ
ncbi:MAG: hypothetical protein ACRDBL_04700 [Rhabdaerophilum sp.]